MNRYEIRCKYCDHAYGTNYVPTSPTFCPKCQSRDLTVKDNAKEKIDYYAGAPDFEDDEPNWNM